VSLDHALRARLTDAGQEWIHDHLEGLDPTRRQALLQQLASLDLKLVADIRANEGIAGNPEGEIEPVGYVAIGDRHHGTDAAERGREALRAGRVACVILAGGQASRLRYDGPKGEYPIGPRSERSLFRILVEQIMRSGHDAGTPLPLAITTSASTDTDIRAFFDEHDRFGFPREALRFAQQRQLPALDHAGRLMLAERDRVFTNPDGHGGALQALENEGILAEWQAAGIEWVATCQVDNPILRVVDPDFIGCIAGGSAPIATKIVLKTEPSEKVGVVANVGGRPALVEYSDLGAEDEARRDADGQLTYRLGSIAAHVFRLDFLRQELPVSLPLHAARKDIPCIDASGNATHLPGTKYERFLFDLFPRAPEVVVCEVLREHEFAPLKNAEGADSPEEVRNALDAQYRRWHSEAGVEPPADAPLEYSPLDIDGPQDLSEA